LVAKLRAHGVTQAWAGSFDGLLHKDVAAVNARLADECRRHAPDLLVPFGTVNPTLPDWEEDLRRCHEEHRMPGIRLYPGYHGYTLQAPVFARLLEIATARQLLVQITCSLEDERTHHPRLQVPLVDLAPLPDLLRRPLELAPMPSEPEPSLTRPSPSARGATADKAGTLSRRTGEGRGEGRSAGSAAASRVQLLNAMRSWRSKPVLDLAAQGVRLEIATLEGVQGIANALARIPGDCLCFGSHAPFYYFESAKLKLQESALSQAQMDAICAGNADRLLNVDSP